MSTAITRRCPTHKRCPDDIVGCGSTNVTAPDDEGLYDCIDCGIWFRADETIGEGGQARQVLNAEGGAALKPVPSASS